jgi:hypothetical protein
MNVEIGAEAMLPRKGIPKWDFLCSVVEGKLMK